MFLMDTLNGQKQTKGRSQRFVVCKDVCLCPLKIPYYHTGKIMITQTKLVEILLRSKKVRREKRKNRIL